MIISVFTYTIQINDIEDIENIEKNLEKKDIYIKIQDIDKIESFILIVGEIEGTNSIIILRNNPLYFKNYYKKVVGNSFETRDFTQHIFSRLNEYSIHYENGIILVEGKEIGKDVDFPESIGILIEGPGFLLNQFGFKNLKMLAALKGKINDEKIREYIRKVGLDPSLKKGVGKIL